MEYLDIANEISAKFLKPNRYSPQGLDYDAVFERLPVTIIMALEAGAVALPIYHKVRRGESALGLSDKGDRADGYSSPLTVADTEVHKKTLDIYLTKFPQDTFEGEEGKLSVKGSKVTIVQDEIDGTQNFALGSGGFSYVNALYVRDAKTGENEHMTSVVYDPLHGVLFIAVRGRGAMRFELTPDANIAHVRSVQVANIDVRTSKFSPYIMMDTMGLGEDPVLRRVLQNLGYKAEPQPGSGLKIAVAASESVVCGMFRSQRGNPDPGDIAAASLLVTEGIATESGWEQNRGKATSLSGGNLLDKDRKFYDGYAIGAPLAHKHIVTANILIEKELADRGITQNEMTPNEWDVLAKRIAADVRKQCP